MPGPWIVFGIVLMFLTERVSLDALAASEEEKCEATGKGPAPRLLGDLAAAADVEAPGVSGAGEEHSHEHLSAITAARSIVSQHAGHAHGTTELVQRHGSSPVVHALAVVREEPKRDGHSHSHSHGVAATPPRRSLSSEDERWVASHSHAHAHGALLLQLSPPSRAHAPAEGEAARADAARRVLTARLLELSIVTHSAIIGLDLGVLVPGEGENLSSITSLIIVLCFHQFFEGLALGSYIEELRDAAAGRAKALMALIFVLTVPVGTWVGIGVASTYSPNSQTAVWVRGSLNGVTGGMLLYSALITFMAEEFSRDDLGGRAGRALKRRMYCCVVLGAACMALLGIWA